MMEWLILRIQIFLMYLTMVHKMLRSILLEVKYFMRDGVQMSEPKKEEEYLLPRAAPGWPDSIIKKRTRPQNPGIHSGL